MSINLLRRQYEGTPQHSHLFGCEFGQNRDIIFWLNSMGVPGRDVTIGKIPWMNGQYNYVQRPTLAGSWSCDFVVYEDMGAYKFLENWWAKIFDMNTGTMGREENQKDTVSIYLLDSTGRIKTIEWVLYGVLLESFKLGETTFTMGSDTQFQTVTSNFQYEYFKTSIGGAGLTDGITLSQVESSINALL